MASLRACTDGPSPASDQPSSCYSGTTAAAESTQGGPSLRTPAHQQHTQKLKQCARQPRHDRITSESRTQQANGQAKALSDYQLGKTIGQGTFGKVKRGFHSQTGERVAIKILEKSKIIGVADEERVTREISILKRSRHPNVIQLYEVIDTPTRISLIMEFCDGGEVFDYIVANQRVAEPQACTFFHQVVNGVEYLHSMGVCHRDLKPENLLLQSSPTGWVVKIIDFGLSTTHLQGQLLSTACGSPCYAAPEMVAGRRYVGPKADVWSMGVLLFALVCGYLPFEDTNTPTLYKKILSGKYKSPTNVSKAVKDLIGRLLDVNPDTRFSTQDIRQHDWYTQVHIDPPHLHTNCEEVIEEPVMQQLEKLGLCREAVAAGLRQGLHDSNTTAYYLLLKRSRQQQRRETRSTRRRSLPASFKYDPLRMACPAAGVDNKDRGDAAGCHTKEGSSQADKENGPTGAVVVPKLALHEIRTQAENAQISEAVPSYRRQTISGSCKLVKGREEPAAASARPKELRDAARAGTSPANPGISRQVAAAGGGRPASAGPRQGYRGSTNTVPKTGRSAQAPIMKSQTQRPSNTTQSGGSTGPQAPPLPWTYAGITRAWMSRPPSATPPADEQELAGGHSVEGTSVMGETPEVPEERNGEEEPVRVTKDSVDESVDERLATEMDTVRVREGGATEEEEKGSCAEGVQVGSAEMVLSG